MVLCIACPLFGKPVYFSLGSLTTVHDYIDSFCCEVLLCIVFCTVYRCAHVHMFFLCKSQKEFSQSKVSSEDR